MVDRRQRTHRSLLDEEHRVTTHTALSRPPKSQHAKVNTMDHQGDPRNCEVVCQKDNQHMSKDTMRICFLHASQYVDIRLRLTGTTFYRARFPIKRYFYTRDRVVSLNIR